MDWEAVRIFLACARAGSLRGAAETLGVNHATVTRRLRSLEVELGARLFDRTTHGLAPTIAGRELIAPAERMEAEAMLISRRVAGLDAQPAGPVRVTLPPVLAQHLLAPDLAAFSEAFPEIELQLTMTNQFLDLQRNEADVSIRYAHTLQDSDSAVRKLVRAVNCVYGAPEYFAARPDLAVGDGSDADWLGWEEDDKRPQWIIDSPFPNARLRHALPDTELHIEAAAAGMGLTYLPAFVGDADKRLRRAPNIEPKEDRTIWLLIHSDLRQTARVRAFVDFIAPAILAHKAAIRGEIAAGPRLIAG